MALVPIRKSFVFQLDVRSTQMLAIITTNIDWT